MVILIDDHIINLQDIKYIVKSVHGYMNDNKTLLSFYWEHTGTSVVVSNDRLPFILLTINGILKPVVPAGLPK
jgi:hypothetical protein